MYRRFKAGRYWLSHKMRYALKRKPTKEIFYVYPQRLSLCEQLYGTILDECFFLDVVEGATALNPLYNSIKRMHYSLINLKSS